MLLGLSQTGSDRLWLFGQGQGSCATSPLCTDGCWGHLFSSISEHIALGECLCTTWAIQSDPQMDAALTSSRLQVSAKHEGEVDPGNLSPVIVFLFFFSASVISDGLVCLFVCAFVVQLSKEASAAMCTASFFI